MWTKNHTFYCIIAILFICFGLGIFNCSNSKVQNDIRDKTETPWLKLGTDISSTQPDKHGWSIRRFEHTYILPLQSGSCILRTISITRITDTGNYIQSESMQYIPICNQLIEVTIRNSQ